MGKTIKIQLSSRELWDLANRVADWRARLYTAADNVSEDLCNLALKEMQRNYNNFPYKSNTGMDFEITGDKTRRRVAMIGTQAIYTEFGTGTRGEENPHPIKGNFALNPYNSGPTIRKATILDEMKYGQEGIAIGDLFWVYMDENGAIKATKGIPAGKQVYDAAKTVKQKSAEIVHRRIKEVLR